MMAMAVDADMGAILGIDSISDNLVYRATIGLPNTTQGTTLSFSQHEGLAGWGNQSQQSVVVAAVQNEPRGLRMSELGEEPHLALSAHRGAEDEEYGAVNAY